jgi:serine/threonine protein kinase
METYVLEEIGLIGHTINNDSVIDTMLDTIIGAANSTSFKTVIMHDRKLITCNVNNRVDYYILKTIGAGAYGKIYLLQNKITKYVLKAQKYDSTDAAKQTQNLKAMLKEAIIHFILYKNNSTNFPQIFQIAWTDTHFYIVMEYLDPDKGSILNDYPLFKRIADKKKDEYMIFSCNIATKVAKILKPLQESLKYSHGDVHFGNLYLQKDNNIKILDFGFSGINLGTNRIITNDLNTHYKTGKDITILTRTILYHLPMDTVYVSDGANFIYEQFAALVDAYNDVFFDARNFYLKLDKTGDNLGAAPNNILTILKDCKFHSSPAGSPAASVAASPATSIGGARTKVRKTPSRKLQTRHKTKKLSQRKSSMPITMDEAFEMLKGPVELIHDKKSSLDIKSLEKILKTSPISHIQKYASKIATLYLKEKEDSLDLDLFKILLYYDGEHFDTFTNEYNALKTLPQKQMYLYGTDLVHSTYIHWNTKDTRIKL